MKKENSISKVQSGLKRKNELIDSLLHKVYGGVPDLAQDIIEACTLGLSDSSGGGKYAGTIIEVCRLG